MAHGELSLAEIVNYLESSGSEYQIISRSEQVMIMDAYLDVNDAMSKLGGLFKIGTVNCALDVKDVLDEGRLENKLNSKEYYNWIDDKVRWCLSFYSDVPDFEVNIPDRFQDYFRQRLRKDGVKKAKYIFPKKVGKINRENISDDIIKKHIIGEGLEFLVSFISEKYYVGVTQEVVRNQEFINRDLCRPFQNPKESIPPKIARIMVNLTGLSAGDRLLDPFCGIGTILQEASILGLQVFGSDINRKCISETRSNLKWLSETYNLEIRDISDRIFTADATQLSKYMNEEIDGIATEPILLPPLKRFPSEDEAENMLHTVGKTYETFLPEISNVLKKGGKLVLVTPYIRTNKHTERSFNLKEAFKNSGLIPYSHHNGPQFEYPIRSSVEKNKKVSRGIHVLEKL
jgi:tRNA G10  N-methylase Trm11